MISFTGGGELGVELGVVVRVVEVTAEGGGHEVVAGTGLPGQGDSWPTMVGLGSGAARLLPNSRGPDPRARNGITSN